MEKILHLSSNSRSNMATHGSNVRGTVRDLQRPLRRRLAVLCSQIINIFDTSIAHESATKQVQEVKEINDNLIRQQEFHRQSSASYVVAARILKGSSSSSTANLLNKLKNLSRHLEA